MRKIDPAKQQAKRQQILEAAVICFAKQGFHATSTAQICAQAGMSPGNLFHYFPTKDAIIQAIAELDRGETAAAMARLAAHDDVVVGLQALALEALLAASDPSYAAISIEVAAEAARNPVVAALFAANDAVAHAQISALLAQGVARGHVDGGLDLGQTASWLLALVEGGVGRAAIDREFDAHASHATLSLIIERFLRPRS